MVDSLFDWLFVLCRLYGSVGSMFSTCISELDTAMCVLCLKLCHCPLTHGQVSVCTGGQDCYTKIWCLRSGKLLHSIPPPYEASLYTIPAVQFSTRWGGTGNMGLIMGAHNSFYLYGFQDGEWYVNWSSLCIHSQKLFVTMWFMQILFCWKMKLKKRGEGERRK